MGDVCQASDQWDQLFNLFAKRTYISLHMKTQSLRCCRPMGSWLPVSDVIEIFSGLAADTSAVFGGLDVRIFSSLVVIRAASICYHVFDKPPPDFTTTLAGSDFNAASFEIKSFGAVILQILMNRSDVYIFRWGFVLLLTMLFRLFSDKVLGLGINAFWK